MDTPAAHLAPAPRARLLFALLGGVALAVAVAAGPIASGSSERVPARVGPSPAALAAFEGRTGVQLVRVAVTGGGGIVDLRYRVIDPDKAGAVHDRANPIAVIEGKTGRTIDELFMNHGQSGHKPKAGVVYYVLLVNTEGMVDRDERVAVRLGGFTLRDVPVR